MTHTNTHILEIINNYQKHKKQEDLNKLLQLYDKKIRSLITKSTAVSFEDLYQEAIVSFIETIRDFNPVTIESFDAYLVTRIKRELATFFHKNTRIVSMITNSRVKKAMQYLLSHADTGNIRYTQKDILEISDSLGISYNDTLIAYVYLYTEDTYIKAEETRDHESSELACTASMPYLSNDETVEEMIQKRDTDNLNEALHESIKNLDDRRRKVVKLRWLSDDKKTLRTLSSDLSVSIERVRQIQEEAFITLRQKIASYA